MKPFLFFVNLPVLGAIVLAGCAASNPIAPTATPSQPPTPTPAAGSVLWTYHTGNAIWSSPSVSDGMVFFGSDDMSVYALDVNTHSLRWKFTTRGFVRSRPSVSNGVAYISSDDGYLYAIDASTGIEKWRADLGADRMQPRSPLTSGYDYQQSSPVVADGRVYIGSDASAVYAFDAVSGQQLWQFQTASPVRSTPAVLAGRVFIGDGSATLHALDAVTGSEVWNAQGCDIPTPAVSNGLVYCGSRGTYQVRAWDVQNGEKRWQFFVGESWVNSSPRIVGGTLYIGSSDAGALFALDPLTGDLLWKFHLSGYAWCSPAVAQGVVYIGSYGLEQQGFFYAVDAKSGVLRWSMAVNPGVVSSPVVADGVIYFGGLDGNLYAVKE